jgi:gamma-glutamylcyclotransferase (GGCT)/AIG2-like uncharacterized protein YtfP
MTYLFVYGTLRKNLIGSLDNAELMQIMRELKFVGTGFANGQLYDLGDYPGAILGENFDTKIFGEVYQLDDPKTTLEALDLYENFIPGELEASLFARVKTKIFMSDESEIEAWIYVYNSWVATGKLIESGDYAKYRSGNC